MRAPISPRPPPKQLQANVPEQDRAARASRTCLTVTPTPLRMADNLTGGGSAWWGAPVRAAGAAGLSRVERAVRDREGGGSNPLAPMTIEETKRAGLQRLALLLSASHTQISRFVSSLVCGGGLVCVGSACASHS